MYRLIVLFAGLVVAGPAWAVCPSTPTDCPSGTANNWTVANSLSVTGAASLLGGGTLGGSLAGSPTFTGNLTFSGAGIAASYTGPGAILLPVGTTGQQPDTGNAGEVRYNSTTGRYEFGIGGSWINHVRLSGDTMLGALHLWPGSTVTDPGLVEMPDATATFAVQYGPQTAEQIFAKLLHVPPRGTSDALQGILTLPASATNNNLYHTGLSGYCDNQSSTGQGICYAVGGYSVADANNVITGGLGSVTSDSPLQSGIYSNIRLQHEFDFYGGSATTSIRGLLNDLFFLVAPNSDTSLVSLQSNLFNGATGVCTVSSYSGTTMNVTSCSSGSLGVGMRVQGTHVDGTANIVISSGSGTSGAFTLSSSIGSFSGPFTIEATSTFPWNVHSKCPSGICQVAYASGARNYAASLTAFDTSQITQFAYTNSAAVERDLQMYARPMASGDGGVLYLDLKARPSDPASYAVQNNAINGAFFGAMNDAQTSFIDLLHLDSADAATVGAGTTSVVLSTLQGSAMFVVDDGVATTAPIAVKGSTSTNAARMYPTSGHNLALSNVRLAVSATSGFTSPWPVIHGAPSTPLLPSNNTAYAGYDDVSTGLDVYDTPNSAWRHVSTLKGAIGAGATDQKLLTSGSSYVPPEGVYAVLVTLVGAGGGGGGVSAATATASAGLPGVFLSAIVPVTPGVAVSYAIGASGAAGSNAGGNGGTGGDTTFSTLTAKGGIGGFGSTTGNAGAQTNNSIANLMVNPSALIPVVGSPIIIGREVSLVGVAGLGGGSGAPGRGLYGVGGTGGSNGSGGDATGYGASGGGAGSTTNTAGTGGLGAPGVIFLTPLVGPY